MLKLTFSIFTFSTNNKEEKEENNNNNNETQFFDFKSRNFL